MERKKSALKCVVGTVVHKTRKIPNGEKREREREKGRCWNTYPDRKIIHGERWIREKEGRKSGCTYTHTHAMQYPVHRGRFEGQGRRKGEFDPVSDETYMNLSKK